MPMLRRGMRLTEPTAVFRRSLDIGAGALGRRPGPDAADGDYAVTACLWSLLVTWMLRGLAASRTGIVKVSTPAV